MILKDFQRDAVDNVSTMIRNRLTEHSNNKLAPAPQIVFKSPTGSGKTIMAGEILRTLADYFDDHNYAFVWAAPNKLHEQSRKKISKLLADTEYTFMDVEAVPAGALLKNTVLFSNWEKVFRKKGDEWANTAVRRGEDGKNLQDILDATRDAGIGIILIVDESHQTFYGKNSQEFVNTVIKPDLVLEISATPKSKSTDIYDVPFNEVVESGLIKKEVCVNNNIANNINERDNAIEVVVKSALDKRDELERIYQDNNIGVNPLVLIQLPNDKETTTDLDIKDRNIVENILQRRGYKYRNGDVAIWLSSEKENLDNIEDNLNKVKVLIFKTAIALGWDCPRAQILVMLRDMQSETFTIQTVGRVLRMPEARHYENDDLNRAYVYTNLSDIIVDNNDTDAKNLIKNQYSYRREGITQVTLPSIFLHRTDYGDLRADFKGILETFLDQTFKVDDNEIVGEKRYEKIDGILEMDDKELTTPIISNAVFNNIDKYKREEFDVLSVNADPASIEKAFNIVLRSFTGHFKNWARTKSIVCGTLYSWFHKANIGIEQVQKIIACSALNQETFEFIFSRALDVYDSDYRAEMIKRRSRELEELEFSIPKQDIFSENYEKVYSPNNAMQEYYRKVNAPQTEKNFEEALNRSNKIEWWYKNGEKMRCYFAIPFYELDEKQKTHRKAFYPDYIIKYKDGTTGIYDTKSGFTTDNDKTRQKANALQKFIHEHADLNLCGGIIDVKSNGTFYLQDNEEYDKDGEWRQFKI